MTALPRLAHRTAIVAQLGLIALLLSWLTWLAPPDPGLVAPLVLLGVGPLAAGVRGILHGRHYTCAWTSLISMGYFIHGVAYVTTPGLTGWLAALEIALSLALFAGCVTYVRLSRS